MTNGGGQSASDSITVYVTDGASAVGTLRFDLELAGITETVLTRCVTFELFDSGGGSQVVETEVSIANGAAAGLEIPIPSGVYTCIAARDARHTLRRTFDQADGFGTADGRYVASFRVALGEKGSPDGTLSAPPWPPNTSARPSTFTPAAWTIFSRTTKMK